MQMICKARGKGPQTVTLTGSAEGSPTASDTVHLEILQPKLYLAVNGPKLRFIDRHHQRPFFLYLPFNAPHGASTFDKGTRQVPEKYLSMYGGGLDWNTQYKALVTQMDEAIGEILTLVEKLGLDNRTLVMFSIDNGGTGTQHNGSLRGAKGTLFEGGVRVPLIARCPGRRWRSPSKRLPMR